MKLLYSYFKNFLKFCHVIGHIMIFLGAQTLLITMRKKIWYEFIRQIYWIQCGKKYLIAQTWLYLGREHGDPEICVRYFLSVLSKTRENLDKLNVYFSIFEWYYQKKAVWQFDKIGVLVIFIIQKLKSKGLVCLSFL